MFGIDDALLGGLLSFGTGLLGMGQENEQADRQSALEERGLRLQERLSEPQIKALERLFGLASGFDPIAEAQAGIQQAGRVTQENIDSALRGFNVSQAAGGATPGQSTAQHVRAQSMTDRAADPLRAYLAEKLSNPTEQRMQMFQRVLGSAPSGNLADTYFKLASQHQPNYGGSLGMLGSGLEGILGGIFKDKPKQDRDPNNFVSVLSDFGSG